MAEEERIAARDSRPAGRPSMRAAAMLIALLVVGLAQRAVDVNSAPFSWPGLGWLDERLADAFGSPSELSFAVPLFLAGAVAFGLAGSTFVRDQAPSWRAAPLKLPVPWAAAVGAGAAALLAMSLSLALGRYEPVFRFVFLAAIGGAAIALFAYDIRGGRLRWHPNRGHLLEAAVVVALAGAFIGMNARDLANWRYSAIGDEAGFFQLANQIIDSGHVNWFSQRDGVGSIHPVLTSVWHAGSMLLFGRDILGWKLGTLLAIAIVLPPYYLLLRELFSGRVAVFGTLFLAASHYLFAYAHTGYDNIFALFPTVAALACAIAGLKRGSPALLFLAGVFAGLGFYTFHSSRVTIALLAFVLLARFDKRGSLAAGAWVGLGFVLTVLPLFATDGWSVLSASSDQSVFDSDQPLVTHIEQNVLRSLLGFSFNPYALHYTAGALVDTITLVFAISGLGLAVARWRQFACQLLLVWFAAAIVVAGALTLHTEVSISRLHYVLPPIAALAAVSLDASLRSVEAAIRSPRAPAVLTALTIAGLAPALFILNGRQFFLYSAHHAYTTSVTVAMRELLDSRCDEQPLRSIVYDPAPEGSLDLSLGFYRRSDSGPVQLAYQDVPFTYGGLPDSGGTGCLVLDDTGYTAGKDLAGTFAMAGLDVREVTDLTGRMKNGLVLPVADSGLVPADVAADWHAAPTGAQLTGVFRAQRKGFLQAVNAPAVVGIEEAGLDRGEPVIVVEARERVRAYPVRFLMWHGVVNDTIAGVPLAVTYDPISGSARVFNRRIDGDPGTFGVSGLVKNGNALLFDAGTESWWQQLSGEAIAGPLAGQQLGLANYTVLSGGALQAIAAGSAIQIEVMATPDDGLPYQRNPYLHYDARDAKPIFTAAQPDSRLSALARVVVIEVGDSRVAVALPDRDEVGTRAGVIEVNGTRLAVLLDGNVVSELDDRRIFNGRKAGSVSVFELPADERATVIQAIAATFATSSGQVVNMLGHAGQDGQRLVPVPHYTAFWFSVTGVYPGIEITEVDWER